MFIWFEEFLSVVSSLGCRCKQTDFFHSTAKLQCAFNWKTKMTRATHLQFEYSYENSKKLHKYMLCKRCSHLILSGFPFSLHVNGVFDDLDCKYRSALAHSRTQSIQLL